MKIGLVCPYRLQGFGGVQTHIRELAEALRARGHRVVNIGPRGQRGAENSPQQLEFGLSQGIRFSGTSFELSWVPLRELKEVRESLKREQFDLLHLHTPWNPFLPLQLACLSSAPKVATFHDVAAKGPVGWVMGRWVMPAAAHLLKQSVLKASIAVASEPLSYLTHWSSESCHLIPNGVRAHRSAKAGPQKDAFTVLYLGRLEPRKDVTTLLEAFHHLSSHHPKARLVLAGDGHLRTELEQQCRTLGLHNVDFRGSVDEETKWRLYSECDVFCSPALYGESFGIVLLEAMSLGKPVVAAANSGYRSILQGPGAEFLFPPGDSEALAAKLRTLLTDPKLRERLGRWGQAEVLQYDWASVAARVEGVYLQALAEKGRGSAASKR